jgi:hypothetical protein
MKNEDEERMKRERIKEYKLKLNVTTMRNDEANITKNVDNNKRDGKERNKKKKGIRNRNLFYLMTWMESLNKINFHFFLYTLLYYKPHFILRHYT